MNFKSGTGTLSQYTRFLLELYFLMTAVPRFSARTQRTEKVWNEIRALMDEERSRWGIYILIQTISTITSHNPAT